MRKAIPIVCAIPNTSNKQITAKLKMLNDISNKQIAAELKRIVETYKINI